MILNCVDDGAWDAPKNTIISDDERRVIFLGRTFVVRCMITNPIQVFSRVGWANVVCIAEAHQIETVGKTKRRFTHPT
jgi:hypothetical protein